jgi:hypothetical protein
MVAWLAGPWTLPEVDDRQDDQGRPLVHPWDHGEEAADAPANQTAPAAMRNLDPADPAE